MNNIGVGKYLYLALVAKDFFRNILLYVKRRLIKRAIRSVTLTRHEYDEGAWQSIFAERAWESFDSLEDYVCAKNDSRKIVCLIDGKISKVTAGEYYRFRRDNLATLLSGWVDAQQELIELGCGYGINLFSLIGTAAQPKYMVGMDVSEKGLTAGGQIAGYFNIDNVEFLNIDLLDVNHKNMAIINGKTVFTYYCLEQLGNYMDQVLDNLIKAKPKRVIHIEPTREILDPSILLDLNSIIYSHSMDYPSTLIAGLKAREEVQELKILKIEKRVFAPTLRHYPAFIVWEPRESGS
jgi:SAM-dependent methyltransferase